VRGAAHRLGNIAAAIGGSQFWRFLRASRRTQVGLAIVAFWVLASLLAPVVSPYSPVEPHPADILQPPSSRYLLGTDGDGFDVLSRILWAPRVDLAIAVVATTLAVIIGVIIGAFAGYFGGKRGVYGKLAGVAMRIVDVSLAFPLFIFALTLVGMLGPKVTTLVVALTFVSIPPLVWLTRSQVLSVREMTFVEAARCSGNSEWRAVLRHVLPNSLPAPLAQVSVILGGAILATAGLSFVGAGVRVPTPEWGLMIAEGSSALITGQWWASVFPGVAIGTCVLGFGLLADGLRVYLDPRQRRQAERTVLGLPIEAVAEAFRGSAATEESDSIPAAAAGTATLNQP
jgi:peptide/nickel transport system permease protein